MKIIFAGTPEFAAAHLSALVDSPHQVLAVITQPDKPGKRGKKTVPSAVKQVALANNLALLQPKRLSIADICKYNADLLIVVAFGQILKKDILDYPQLGCINVHASLLPRWRGAAPIQRALQAGDAETGVCIIRMNEGLDTGDVLSVAHVSIDDNDTAATLTKTLATLGVNCLLETLPTIAASTCIAVPQQDHGASYATKLLKDEAIINWCDNITNIERNIRAFNPDPIAYSYLGELRIKIWAAQVLESDINAPPGEILKLDREGVHVAAGGGTVILQKLQLPLGKGTVLSSKDILNSRRDLLQVGKTFADHARV